MRRTPISEERLNVPLALAPRNHGSVQLGAHLCFSLKVDGSHLLVMLSKMLVGAPSANGREDSRRQNEVLSGRPPRLHVSLR